MTMKNILNNRAFTVAATLLIGLFLGWLIFAPSHKAEELADEDKPSVASTWTCSMHPSVRQPDPGKCPICGMDLIPLEATSDNEDPMMISMSPTAMKLANVQSMVVGGAVGEKVVRLNGKIQADERRVSSQAAHVPGRIEELLVNFTGEYVNKGRTVAMIYSPELVTAQQELLEANKIKETQPALYAAAREKMKNWKLSEKQIDDMQAGGKVSERFPVVADVSGFVLKRNVAVGDYVSRGKALLDVVDLSRVWIQFEVYERDIPWIKTGGSVEFTVQSLPGETFKGKVSFIDPIINPATRVALARVEMVNPGQRLKPEMFVTGVVTSNLGNQAQIVVPKSAVMWTGERSVVYLKYITDTGVAFGLREVVLGPALGDAYVVRSGLELGEEVVTNGAFTIDAAAQLAGKPSMMSPDGGAAMTGHQHGTGSDAHQEMQGAVNDQFKSQLRDLLDPYLVLEESLVKGDVKASHEATGRLAASLSDVDMTRLKPDEHEQWMPLVSQIDKAIKSARGTQDIEAIRQSFAVISDAYFKAIQAFSVQGMNVYYQFCPMAFDNKGAYWISKTEDVRNPYFGSKMLSCGEIVQEIK
jgi:Cu(I)/Ag(I) efflux system membrane fusion protein